jgi:hypothetical protein
MNSDASRCSGRGHDGRCRCRFAGQEKVVMVAFVAIRAIHARTLFDVVSATAKACRLMRVQFTVYSLQLTA